MKQKQVFNKVIQAVKKTNDFDRVPFDESRIQIGNTGLVVESAYLSAGLWGKASFEHSWWADTEVRFQGVRIATFRGEIGRRLSRIVRSKMLRVRNRELTESRKQQRNEQQRAARAKRQALMQAEF